MKENRQLADFILRFQLGDIAASLTISMVVWVIFERFDSNTFTTLTLGTLATNTILMKRCSYIFDNVPKKSIIQWLNTVMAAMTLCVILIDWSLLYLLLYWLCALYFQIFYTTWNALAQTLSLKNKQLISTALEFSGKIVGFFVAALIWVSFEPLGTQRILLLATMLFALAAWIASHFNEPVEKRRSIQKQKIKQGFTWYFRQPVAWLVTISIIPNVMVLLSNTIDSIYFYQVLSETPQSLALLGMAFSIGSMTGVLLVLWTKNEKNVIYASVLTSASMSLIVALFPTVSTFTLALGVFGLVNSASRVMFRLAIMKSIPDANAGSFYSLRSSLVSGIQLAALFTMELTLKFLPPAISVWFFPAVLLALPILWTVSQNQKSLN